MTRRVVVTGVGMVNPMGHDVETVWKGLKEGASGVGYTSIFDASNFPTKISAEVKDWDVTKCGEKIAEWERQVAIPALPSALPSRQSPRLACWTPLKIRPASVFTWAVAKGIKTSTRSPTWWSRRSAARKAIGTRPRSFARAWPRSILAAKWNKDPSMPCGHLASLFNAQGPNLNCLTACAASSQAIGEARELIRRGTVDVMLSGGAHSMIHPFGVTGFNLLTALSTRNDEPTRASRPFDRERDGFVLGEGASMVVLEELEHAKPVALRSTAKSSVTAPPPMRSHYRYPSGRSGGIACMKMAMQDAGITPQQVDYVNAHGTSTTVNDKVETLCCKEAFGEHAKNVPVSSTKSMMGHLIAAAGVTEAIVCLLAIRDNVLPPTINYENPDDNCDLDYIPNEAREAKCDIALNNSFGFGGQNITLALSRFAG